MFVSRWLNHCIGLAILMTLSGCSSFDERTDFIAQSQADIQTAPTWPKLDGSQTVTSLNDLFESKQVDELIDKAFENNTTLQQTILNRQISLATRQLTESSQYADISAGVTSTAKQDNANQLDTNLTLNWELDVWNRLSDTSRAAEYDVVEQTSLLEAAKNSLAADVIKSWLSLIAQKRAIHIQHQRVSTLADTKNFILARYKNGLGTLSDLDSAKTSLANAEATLEKLNLSYSEQLSEINYLIGLLPRLDIDIPDEFPTLPIAEITLPEQTLSQRPDLRAAFAAIQANALRTDVAYKAMLPEFSIQALLSNSGTTLRDALFVSPIWSLLINLSQPIYQGGEYQAEATLAELETAKAYQAYRDTLLTAVKEVDIAIQNELSLNAQQSHYNDALDSADNTLKQYQTSYRSGLVTILDLLEVQQQNYDIQANLNTTQLNLMLNRVNLGLALALGIKS
jgi:outer membrane protein TolC